ncbi:MAG: tyrosine-type recombinase/integrase [Cytophagia bacterium]|uniref:tyrosine-type recombinase/integrase n=1 Tax=Salipiger sp. HF18 TaxID=2721557 RepID=UPI00142E1EAE|nr:tyrosine-type recombinase/integrase [Salipiger sp. HF18]NIY97980.1 tyrosine-type recombinase/integrase [Salipiger sp. HF18]NVK84015.1 tyrosine-type recombinase/integrase [Cytophagia bacterium]
MKVRLKGVNRVSVKLANGDRVTYYYAWKGGPRLPGKPGDPEFIAAYNAAVAQKAKQPTGTIQAILNAYQDSPKFNDLAPRTRKDYVNHIRKIETEFGDFPLAALHDRRTRAEFLGWRDRMAVKSRRQADYVFATFAAIMAWAFDRGLTVANPCERPGKLYRASRSDSIWTQADEDALLKVAPPRIRLAYLLAVWTGQRQGDLLRLTWTAYDGSHIRLKQGKTGRRVVIPVAGVLKAALDEAAQDKKAVTILTTTKGTAWTGHGFSATWRKTLAKAQVTGLTFHDLRGTAVTRLAIAGCSEAEIATFTGHSLRDVGAILDAHYLSRDARLAESALSKREAHEAGTKIPK